MQPNQNNKSNQLRRLIIFLLIGASLMVAIYLILGVIFGISIRPLVDNVCTPSEGWGAVGCLAIILFFVSIGGLLLYLLLFGLILKYTKQPHAWLYVLIQGILLVLLATTWLKYLNWWQVAITLLVGLILSFIIGTLFVQQKLRGLFAFFISILVIFGVYSHILKPARVRLENKNSKQSELTTRASLNFKAYFATNLPEHYFQPPYGGNIIVSQPKQLYELNYRNTHYDSDKILVKNIDLIESKAEETTLDKTCGLRDSGKPHLLAGEFMKPCEPIKVFSDGSTVYYAEKSASSPAVAVAYRLINGTKVVYVRDAGNGVIDSANEQGVALMLLSSLAQY